MTRLGALTVVAIEDSPAPRAHLVRAREAEGDSTVVGQGAAAGEAAGIVQRSTSEVVTVDRRLADGGGRHPIEQIMGCSPAPIPVPASSGTGRESAAVGAVGVVQRSKPDVAELLLGRAP